MDYSLPVSSVHVIFQARILEWVAISRGSSRSGIETGSLVLQSDFLPTELPGKPITGSLMPSPQPLYPPPAAQRGEGGEKQDSGPRQLGA